MVTRLTITATAALALLLGATAARAKDPCIGDAKGTYRECKADCKETYQTAKDACHNKDHACVEVCRADREQCRIDSGIDADLDACDDSLAAAKQICRNTYPAGSSERDSCIDQAQVVGFQCRDQARENNKAELKACRAAFRACVQACPEGSGPVVDPRQCKADAKAAYKQCTADCKEDFQVQKDACRNLDHACVEACRDGRSNCKAPVKAALEAAFDVCQAQRNADVDDCKLLYPPDSVERDQCIDNAQVDAFVCRDAAREAARPGFQACRQGFRDCVEQCPPASASPAFLD